MKRRTELHWFPWLALLCLAWCGAAFALSPDESLLDLKRTDWGPKEGAPSTIVAIAQTSDGYLWLGNGSGLFRFDGLRFVQVDLPRDERLTSANVFSLFAPASGGLWIGFTFGGVAFLKDGQLTSYAERDGLPHASAKSFAQDSEGVVWVGTASGLARLNGSRWQQMDAAQGYTDTQTLALLVDSAGTLWAASNNKVLVLRSGEKNFRETGVAISVNSIFPVGIAESPEGKVWLLDDKGLHRLRKNDNPGRRSASSGLRILFDRDGALWAIGTDSIRRVGRPEQLPAETPWDQIEKLAPSADEFKPPEGNSDGLFEDREGNVWSLQAPGLKRFSERSVARVASFPKSLDDDFNLYLAAIAAAEEGALWVGGRTFAPFRIERNSFDLHAEIGPTSCVIRGEDGSTWFGGTKGLWKYASGRFEKVALPEGMDGYDVQAMAQERSGALWISVVRKGGVFRLMDGSWTLYGGIPALPKLPAVTLATDAKGRVWFGYVEGRVAMLDGNTVTEFSEGKRLPVGNVTGLYGKRSGVWAGGEFGLARFDGTVFRSLVPEIANAFNGVTGIVETADGDLWVNGRSGITHITAAEIQKATKDASHRVHVEAFDANDGVEGSPARLRPLPTAIEGTDGRLWFLTDLGLYWLDPARLHRNPLPPPVRIESLVVGDMTFKPSEGMKLPERTTALRIDYVAPSLTLAEKVRYRYKLEGVDDGWQDPQGRRQAFYTNLGPGTHRFHVIAANNDGVWNETGATLDFVIPPTFVQTRWFIALCVLGAAVALGALVKVRYAQLAARLRLRYEERMAERERIARELHDTLLQSTQGLVLKVQAAANSVSPDEPAHGMLEEALTRADRVIAEGRDRIQDLRIATDPDSDLATSLAAVGKELSQGPSVQFRALVEGPVRALLPRARDEAYRIGREALLNAFRHAGAKAIEVQAIFSEEDFRLRVRDDGTGMAAAAIEAGALPGHWGLPGMRERAEKIGAQLEVWSRPGAGTEIELRIPAKMAYAGRMRRPRWLPFRRPA
jgi:signal transduction histidine kinase/ligand-binding sensor domain-containing protein